nr:transposase family protein [Sinosporangium album]
MLGQGPPACRQPSGTVGTRRAPLWVADVEPGSVHDLAGICVHTPIKQPVGNQPLSPDNRTYNQFLRGLRSLGERGFSLLKGHWRIFQHITASPSAIGDIAGAALGLTPFRDSRLPETRRDHLTVSIPSWGYRSL